MTGRSLVILVGVAAEECDGSREDLFPVYVVVIVMRWIHSGCGRLCW